MRILFFVAPVSLGGGETQITLFSEELQKRGIEVCIANLFYSREFEQLLTKKGINHYRITNIELGFTPLLKDYCVNFLKAMPSVLSDKKLYKLLTDYEIIHAHGFPPNLCIYMLKLISRIPNSKHLLYSHHTFKSSLPEPLRFLNEKVLDIFDSIIGVSSKTSKSLIDIFPRLKNKICTIPNAINTAIFKNIESDKSKLRQKLNLPHNDILGIYVARFALLKNHTFLLELLNAIDDVNFKIVLLGEGTEKLNFMNLAHSYNLTKRIIYTGNVKNEMVPYYLKACDIYLHPAFKEGFGIAILEAMAAGLPVVIFENVHVEEFGRSVLVARDNNEFIAYVDRLIKDNDFLKAVSIGCYKSSFNLNIEKKVDTYLNLIKKIKPNPVNF